MIYSRSAEYAIRAFVHLAQVPEGKYAMVKNIAEQEEIPAHFLAKILQQLARKGLLRSSKGPTGGFLNLLLMLLAQLLKDILTGLKFIIIKLLLLLMII